MFLRPRLHDVSQRRSLVAIGLVLSASAVIGTQAATADEWVARQAINQQVPLTDPSPNRSPAREQASAQQRAAARQEAAVPRSTLRFVVPESSYGQPSRIATLQPAGSAQSADSEQAADATVAEMAGVERAAEPLPRENSAPTHLRAGANALHALYGPGAPIAEQPAPRTNDRQTDPRQVTLRGSDQLDRDQPAVDPEQNEPLSSIGKESARDDSDAETSITALPQESSSDALAPAPQRLEVRNLKLRVDGSIDPPSMAQTTKAAPSSNRRDDSHQSIGDETIDTGDEHQQVGDEPAAQVAVSTSHDRIGPKGDLLLALGLPENRRLSTDAARLRAPIERTLNYYWVRPENAQERTHWGMFHAMMVYDKDTQILDGKKRYNAVAWMAGNNPCRNDLLFEEDQHGLNVRSGIGLQGHQAQLLAVLGLIDVPANYPIYVGRNKYTVEDIILREMRDCKSGNELTFTLIGLAHYIDTDSQWIALDGEDWNFERLIQEELSQPIVGAACGGTHRLMGFAHALRRRRAEGKPLDGQWARADQYIRDFIAYTWELQNRDGSMSTDWFEKPDDNGKMDRKVQTTGHMVEFLVTALPDDQLPSAKMIRAVSYLVNTLHEERGHEWQIGPKGHALRAIAMYYQRVFGRQDPWRPQSVARVGSGGHR
ncbi:MAG: hypothetical protein ACO1RT_14385 [Planctomycetaceae bacterium]